MEHINIKPKSLMYSLMISTRNEEGMKKMKLFWVLHYNSEMLMFVQEDIVCYTDRKYQKIITTGLPVQTWFVIWQKNMLNLCDQTIWFSTAMPTQLSINNVCRDMELCREPKQSQEETIFDYW